MSIVNEKVKEYLDDFYRPLSDELAQMRASGEELNVPIILRDTEALLVNLLRIQRPGRILEIGTAIGYSAACFATVCGGSRIITVERDRELFETAVENMELLGLSESVHVLLGDAMEVMARLRTKMNVEGLAPFDFVFIDAGKSHYREFWDMALTMCKKGSVIVCDNILMKGKTVSDEYDPTGKYKTNIKNMREFVTYIGDIPEISTSLLSVGDGVSISVIK